MTADATEFSESTHPTKVWAWRIVKWSLCGLVLAFVGRRAAQMWQQSGTQELVFSWPWAIAAGVAYGLGWLPSVWFWRRMLQSCGETVPVWDATRAYFCGHLGKYVPGKATVLVIRSALLRPCGVPMRLSALTATFETLILMGVGAAVATALAPLLLSSEWVAQAPPWFQWFVDRPWLMAGLVVIGCAALLPVLAKLLTAVVFKLTPLEMLGEGRSFQLSTGLLAEAFAVLILGWVILAISLGLTIRAVGGVVSPADLPILTGSVCAATALGFVAIFAPGGLGVREGILIVTLQTLRPDVAESQAVAASILLRLIWFIVEVVIAGSLYSLGSTTPSPQPSIPNQQLTTDN